MRRSMGVLIVLASLSCKGESPTQSNNLGPAPPSLYPTATSFAVAVPGGASELEVSVTLHNYTATHLQAVVSSSCPFAVRFFPDSSGAYEYIGVVGCPAGGSKLDVAPGDSAVLTRMFGADTLATFAPGNYGINILVGTVSGWIGAWAGAIQLPLEPPLAARTTTALPPATSSANK